MNGVSILVGLKLPVYFVQIIFNVDGITFFFVLVGHHSLNIMHAHIYSTFAVGL